MVFVVWWRERANRFLKPEGLGFVLRKCKKFATCWKMILETICFLPAANCHELTGQNAGFLAVDVSANYRLIFQPAEDPPPLKDDGGLDWSAVTEILILDIVDYH